MLLAANDYYERLQFTWSIRLQVRRRVGQIVKPGKRSMFVILVAMFKSQLIKIYDIIHFPDSLVTLKLINFLEIGKN